MKSDWKFRSMVSCLPVLMAGLLTGCGRPSGEEVQPRPTNPPAPTVSISINPTSLGIRKGDVWTFTSIVLEASNSDVTWSIKEGSVGGSIDSSGSYTAPLTTGGVYHVVATSKADATKSAVATVNVLEKGFSVVGNPLFPRLQHTASLLSNGEVLIAGGGKAGDSVDGYYVQSQSETFHPADGSFSGAGTMARDSHTATVLSNGDVLFAGGEVPSSASDSNTAEVWTPETGMYSPTGSMAIGREGHSATLLSDGRVLISGGIYPVDLGWVATAEAELYDASAGGFSVTGSMSIPRCGHTATLLGNGKVLITGGGYPSSTNSAELWDPATGNFSATGSMKFERSSHTATLLPNGKVLIAGGGQETAEELYDPATGTFSVTGALRIPRKMHTATLLSDGTVLIGGGLASDGITASTEIYDPATAAFADGPTMRQARYSHTATLLPDGRVLIVGGGGVSNSLTTNVLASAEVYY